MTFSLVKDLFKSIEGLSRSVIILVGFEAEIILDIGDLRKITEHVVKFRAQKKFLFSFMKSDFQSSQGLVQMK